MRSVRRMIAKIAETYGTIGYTECWGHQPPQSDQNTQEGKDHTIRRTPRKRKKVAVKPPLLKYGIRVPKDTEEAYRLDKENNNTLWSEAIKKELNALNVLIVCLCFVCFNEESAQVFLPFFTLVLCLCRI